MASILDFADQFEFDNASFSSLTFVVTVIVSYLSLLFTFQSVMKSFQPKRLEKLFIIHNSLLSVSSAILLATIAPIIAQNVLSHGIFYSICDRSMAYNPRLNFFYYINYLMKLWELADTFFLVARKKKLQFLHVYHHACTFLLTWSQLAGKTSVQWVPITINLGIHVLMYYYYAVMAAYPGTKIWWKKHLTSIQIVQFVIDLGFIYYCMYIHIFATEKSYCQGAGSAGWLGTFLISSYLYLFLEFFYKTYISSKAIKPKQKM